MMFAGTSRLKVVLINKKRRDKKQANPTREYSKSSQRSKLEPPMLRRIPSHERQNLLPEVAACAEDLLGGRRFMVPCLHAKTVFVVDDSLFK